MAPQAAPLWSQRLHWKLYEIGCVPVHVPGVAVSVTPSRGSPAIVGLRMVAGGEPAAVTVGVGEETAVFLPPLFDAVTEILKRCPTSSSVSVYWRRWMLIGTQLLAFASQRIQ